MAVLKIATSLDRSDLQSFLPDLRTIKAFERLTEAVTATIPNAVNQQSDQISTMGEESQEIADLARTARAAGDRVAAALCRLEERLATQRTERAAISALELRISELESILLNRRH